MLALYVPVVLAAFLITVLEMTEVVAIVHALGAEEVSLRHGAAGAVAGCATVALLALGFGAALLAFPRAALLWAAAVVLAAFGVFLFRSTLKTYRRLRPAALAGPGAPSGSRRILQFAGGFTVGAVEATEVVVVLLALTAAGFGGSAIVGAVLGGRSSRGSRWSWGSGSAASRSRGSSSAGRRCCSRSPSSGRGRRRAARGRAPTCSWCPCSSSGS